MSIVGTFLFGFRHYANWKTAASCGAVLILLAAVLTISYLTRNRSS